jgi:hypothetical protein
VQIHELILSELGQQSVARSPAMLANLELEIIPVGESISV